MFVEWRATFGTNKEPATVIKILQYTIQSLFREAELLHKDGIIDDDYDDNDMSTIIQKSNHNETNIKFKVTNGLSKFNEADDESEEDSSNTQQIRLQQPEYYNEENDGTGNH